MTIQRQDPGAVPGHSTIEIHTREFHCDGPEDGEHPRVYYVFDDDNYLIILLMM